MSLPGAPWLQRRGRSLWLDGVELEALARAHGTPLYVYSRGAIEAAVAAYAQALAGHPHLLCYAVKANPNLAVLQVLARAGCGFDIVSVGELERVLAAGATAAQVVFSGVGKTRAEMARALEAGVGGFNVESLAELERLDEVARAHGRRAPVSLRVNPDVDARTHPYIATGLRDNKFGIAHAQALAAYLHAAALPGLAVQGVACHIGSQITELGPYLAALDRVLDLVEAVEAEGLALPRLDLGGGLGITYGDETPPAPQALVRALLARLAARGHGGRELLLEPGRSLVGNAGVLLTEVLYLKPGAARNFCIVDAGMNDLLRPAIYGAWMAIEPCTQRAAPAQTWDIVGPVCESGDWLGRERALAVASGDILAVLSAGAYAMSMAGNYNSRPRPAEVLVDAGRADLVRAREPLAALWAGERLLAG